MRHRKRGRVLGRSPSHRLALMRNMSSALILTERDAEDDENAPEVKGRIITTLPKAKEVRSWLERCITIARRSLVAQAEADKYATTAERNSDAWKKWRNGDEWKKWSQAMAPVVTARRRCLKMLGSKQAVRILFGDIAPRFADRPGGYTRILRLAKPRLGDAGPRAILEFVGVRDRVSQSAQKPQFVSDKPEADDAAGKSEKPKKKAKATT
jgi:large subunit ribosomal protein L17